MVPVPLDIEGPAGCIGEADQADGHADHLSHGDVARTADDVEL